MATQLITPNPLIPCSPGWCLVYVRETFGISAKHPTAVAAWSASERKHENTDFPDGAWVPVWFLSSDTPAGHVALRQPDGSVWSASHPTDSIPVHHASLQDLMSYYGGRLSYLGWTEDIEDVPVVAVSAATVASVVNDVNHIGQLSAIPLDGPVIKLSV